MGKLDFPYIVRLVVIFLAYFVTAKLGLSFDAVGGFATLVWPPTGIALASLFLWGYRYFPAIFLGAFFVNFSVGAPFLVATAIGVGNTIEAALGAYLLKRFEMRPSLDRLKDVVSLIIVSMFCAMIAATVGVTSLFLSGVISHSIFVPTWLAWWVGDALGVLVIASLFLVWLKGLQINRKPGHLFEAMLAAVFIVILSIAVFRGFFIVQTKGLPITYVLFIPLMWTSLRLGQRATITTLFVLAVISIAHTILGFGPFVGDRLSQNLLFLQSFIGVASVTFMMLASVVSERREFERRKDEFISMASHELKTPITTIKAFTQLLGKMLTRKHEKQAVFYIDRMERQLDRLTDLVNDMLDLSRIQAAKLELRKEQFFLQELIREIVANMQATTATHTIMIEGRVIRKIHGDKERIGQVLINLISNAIKYSPKAKKVILTIRPEPQQVSVSVRDYGIGIAEQYHQKIFDRFFQVSEKDSRVAGLGIGLFISKEIIRRHGGNMSLTSKKGRGSTFSFTLPFAKQ